MAEYLVYGGDMQWIGKELMKELPKDAVKDAMELVEENVEVEKVNVETEENVEEAKHTGVKRGRPKKDDKRIKIEKSYSKWKVYAINAYNYFSKSHSEGRQKHYMQLHIKGPFQMVVDALKIGRSQLSKLLNSTKEEQRYSSKVTKKRKVLSDKLMLTSQQVVSIKHFLRERNLNGEKATLQDIQRLLEQFQDPFTSSIATLRLRMIEEGFKFSKTDPYLMARESNNIIAWRQQYLLKFFQQIEDGYTHVYLDDKQDSQSLIELESR